MDTFELRLRSLELAGRLPWVHDSDKLIAVAARNEAYVSIAGGIPPALPDDPNTDDDDTATGAEPANDAPPRYGGDAA